MSVRSPLQGLQVVEVDAGVSMAGAGMAASLPGALLRDLGAEVVRIEPSQRSTLDAGVEFDRSWNRDKEVVQVDLCDRAAFSEAVAAHLSRADVLLLAGPEELIEQRGLGPHSRSYDEGLVSARVRPTADSRGRLADLELLLHARTGLLSQLRGNREGPTFCGLGLGAAGAALTATVGVLSQIYQREVTGRGGWVETSLLDGVLALLPMIIGRVEHDSPSTSLLWGGQGPAAELKFECGDGRYLQLWFGAKGAYEEFLAHIGDPVSEHGYMADTVSGEMAERSERWETMFATKDRPYWLDWLAGHGFRVEPILRPGEILDDGHVRAIGLSIEVDDPDRGPMRVLGPVVDVASVSGGAGPHPTASPRPAGPDAGWLSGVRVLDLSAYLAGPVTAHILGQLGADVVKVEPLSGDAHRSMEPLFAAGQRGKRALALDLKSPWSSEVLARLFSWADVVHHNSRVGLAERLGYDEGAVRAVNGDVIYCHATGFGSMGSRAMLPANDYLMQALSGMEAAVGGYDAPPTLNSWGSVDVTGGWVAACGVLAGLIARQRTGAGQSVTSNLLGSGALLVSGAFLAGDAVIEGPVVDSGQTGYGAAYRIYRGADESWFALAVPDAEAWGRLRTAVGVAALPDVPPALRTVDGSPQPEELLLEAAFRAAPAGEWVDRLRRAGVPVELVRQPDRRGFISGLLDDPVGRQLGRVVGYEWGERGWLEQPALALRLGPEAPSPQQSSLPGLGQHTAEVLAEIGYDADAQSALAAALVVRLPGDPGARQMTWQ